MKSRLDEDMRVEAKDMFIQNKFLVDVFKPKICHEKDVVVLSFLVKSREAAEDLGRLMAQSPVSVMNIEISSSPDPEGNFIILGEFDRDQETFRAIDQLLNYFNQEMNVNNWCFKTSTSDHTIPWNERNFSEEVVQDPEEFLPDNDNHSISSPPETVSVETVESHKPENPGVKPQSYSATSRESEFSYEVLAKIIDEQVNKSSGSYIRDIKKQLKKLVKENRRLSKKVEDSKLDSQNLMKKREMEKIEGLLRDNQRLLKQVTDKKSDSQYFLKHLEMGRIEQMIRDNQRLLKTINEPKSDDQHIHNRLEIERIGEAVKDNQRLLKQIADANQENRYLHKQLKMNQLRERMSLHREKQDIKRIKELEDRLSYLMLAQTKHREIPITDSSRPAIGVDTSSSQVNTEFYRSVGPETVIVLDEVADSSINKNLETKTESDETDTDHVNELFGLAARASEEKDYSSAIEYFTRLTELKPDEPRIYYNLAILYYLLKDYDTAHKYAKKAEDLGAKGADRIVNKVEAKKIQSDEPRDAESGAPDDSSEIGYLFEDNSSAENQTNYTQDPESRPVAEDTERETNGDIEEADHHPWIYMQDQAETEADSNTTDGGDNSGSVSKFVSYRQALETSDTVMINSRAYDSIAPKGDAEDITSESPPSDFYHTGVEAFSADDNSQNAEDPEHDAQTPGDNLENQDTEAQDIAEDTIRYTDGITVPDTSTHAADDEDELEDTAAMDMSEVQHSESSERDSVQTRIPPAIEKMHQSSSIVPERTPPTADPLNIFDNGDTIMIDRQAFDEIEPRDPDISESDDERPASEQGSEIRDEEIYEPLDSVKSVADDVVLPTKAESEIELQESDIVPESELQQQEPDASGNHTYGHPYPKTATDESDPTEPDSVYPAAAEKGKPPKQEQNEKKQYTVDFYKLGQEALSRRDYGLAIAYFTNYVEHNPREHQGYCELAQLNLKLRKYEVARENAERAELLGSSIAGQLLKDIGHEQAANQTVTNAGAADVADRDKISAKADVIEAVTASETPLEATAVDREITPKITDKPSDPPTEPIRVAFDTVDFGGSKPGQALHGSESDTTGSMSVETVKVNDESSHRFFSLGMEAFERKDYGLAVSYFSEFVGLVPDEPRVHYNLALINYRLRNYDSAKEHAEQAQKLGSDAALKILRRIELKSTGEKQKDYPDDRKSKTDVAAEQKEAVPEIDTEETRSATDPDPEASLKVADEEKDLPPAIDHGVSVPKPSDQIDRSHLPPIEERVDVSPAPLTEDLPATPRDCLERCETAVNEKDYTSAIGHLKQFVELTPDDPRGYFNLAVLYYRLKDYGSAQKQAEHAKELGSDAAEKILVKTADKLSKDLPKPEKEIPVDKTQDHLDDTTYFEMESIEYPGEVIYLLDEQAVTIEKAQTAPDTDAGAQVKEGIVSGRMAPSVETDSAVGPQDTGSTAPVVNDGLKPGGDIGVREKRIPDSEIDLPAENIAENEMPDYDTLNQTRETPIELVDTAFDQEEKNTTFPDNEVQPESILDFSDTAVEADNKGKEQRPEAQMDRLAPFLEAPLEEEVPAVLASEILEGELPEDTLEKVEHGDAIESQTRSTGEKADDFVLGTEAAENKNYKLAIEHFSRFIASAPDEPHAYYNLAVLYYRLKNYKSAKEYAELAKELGSKAAKKVLKRAIDKLTLQQPVFEEDASPNLPNSDLDSTTFFGVTDIDYGKDVELPETVDTQTTVPEVQTDFVEAQVDERDDDLFGKEPTDDLADPIFATSKEDQIESPVVGDAPEPETNDRNVFGVHEDIPAEDTHSVEAGHTERKELSAEHSDTTFQADDGFDDSEENLFDTPENDLESDDDGLQYATAVKQDDFDPFASGETPEADSETDPSDGVEADDGNPIAAKRVSGTSEEMPAGSTALKTEEEVPKDEHSEAPDDAKDYFTLGMEASSKKENEKAIDYFTKFIELKPDESRGHYNLSILYYRLEELDAAERHGKRAFKLGAKPAKVILEKIKKKRNSADRKAKTKTTGKTAEKKQVDAVDTPPAEDVPAKPEQNDRRHETTLDESTHTEGNFETADTATVDTTDMVEDGAVVWGADDLNGEVDEAADAEIEKTADQVFQNDVIVFDNQDQPQDGSPRKEGKNVDDPVKKFYALGLAASDKKDYLAAIQHFTKVTQLLPDDPRGYYNLSLVSYRMKFYESAKEHANRAITLGSKPAKQIIEKIEARKAIA